ncbi:hypothetical protein [Actinoplanes sp. NPDC049681]|uniref:hypothetical protein n=1 Tax=Actinoplanes sp. NPDC049681 TaxID=3363905 RepID=UPI0037A11C9C
MPDLTFIANVAATLLTSSIARHRSWQGRRRLASAAARGLAGDPAATAMLGAAAERPRPDLAVPLADAIRAAAADPRFAAAVRQLIVDAYAEPGMANGLPNPAPLLR